MRFSIIIGLLAITPVLYHIGTELINVHERERDLEDIRIIDTHEHVETIRKAEEFLEVMDGLGIKKSVFVPSPIETITSNGNKTFTQYQKNIDEILKISKTYPDRFIPFCTISPLEINSLEIFKSCHKKGGQGLKLYNGHAFFYSTFGTKLYSPLMNKIYNYAEKNSIPVIFHINIGKYLKQFERVMLDHPDLIVSIPHFMISSLNLKKVGYLFDRYKNLYTDISFGHDPFLAAGFRRISRSKNRYYDFINKYSDRFLFGTDMVLTEVAFKDKNYMETIIQCYRDLLEKESFNCKPVNEYYKNRSDEWYQETKSINGLELSLDVLEKIYIKNPERFLNLK